MSSKRQPKEPAAVNIEALRTDAATVSRLASQPGGVRVMDGKREAFRLVIPSNRLK